MRKLTALISVLILALCACGADSRQKQQPEGEYKDSATFGLWISYSEINAMLLSDQGFEAELEKAVKECEKTGISDVYIHVRSYCDSLYPSQYFPKVSAAGRYDYDVFEKMLDAFHKAEIKVHAWINPYRVLTSSQDAEKLDSGSPAYKWLKDDSPDNDKNVCFYKGIYLNPAESEVRRLVIDGVREIITRYNVDGIHFDDYFYPTSDPNFDSKSYEEYASAAESPLSLGDWRRFNVNALMSGCYSAIKNQSRDIVFSVSPAASIDKNYNDLYADIKEWVRLGYVDTVIPQLYFGFDYSQEEYRFQNLLQQWKELMSVNNGTQLLIGLAFYKTGTENDCDGDEWKTCNDIISRQAELCYNDGFIKGYVIFSYNSFVSDSAPNRAQRENLLDFISGTANDE